MVTGARRNLDVNHAVFSDYLNHTSGQKNLRFILFFADIIVLVVHIIFIEEIFHSVILAPLQNSFNLLTY